MPRKGAKCPLFHAPCRTDTGTTLDATATPWGALHLKVWSWAKGTPRTKMLGERKDSLRFCLLSKRSTKKLSWDAQEGLYFPRLCTTCSHKGMLLTLASRTPGLWKLTRATKKKTSRVQVSSSHRSPQTAKGGLWTCLPSDRKQRAILSKHLSICCTWRAMGREEASTRSHQDKQQKHWRDGRCNTFPQGGACATASICNACQLQTHLHSNPL